MKPVLTLATLPLLAACAATMPPADPDLPGRPAPAGECDASGVQDAIGQRATAELGSDLLRRCGAGDRPTPPSRWITGRTALTSITITITP